MREDQAAVAAAVAERLEGHRGGERIEPAAAVLLRDGQALQPDVAALLPQLARERLLAVALGRRRR